MSVTNECWSCGEGYPIDECPTSKRQCGHHCNHVWTHDECCWCGKEFGCDDESEQKEDETDGTG